MVSRPDKVSGAENSVTVVIVCCVTTVGAGNTGPRVGGIEIGVVGGGVGGDVVGANSRLK